MGIFFWSKLKPFIPVVHVYLLISIDFPTLNRLVTERLIIVLRARRVGMIKFSKIIIFVKIVLRKVSDDEFNGKLENALYVFTNMYIDAMLHLGLWCNFLLFIFIISSKIFYGTCVFLSNLFFNGPRACMVVIIWCNNLYCLCNVVVIFEKSLLKHQNLLTLHSFRSHVSTFACKNVLKLFELART